MMTLKDILSKRINEYMAEYSQIPRLKMYYSTYDNLLGKHSDWFTDSKYEINIQSHAFQTQIQSIAIVKAYLWEYEVEMIDDRLRDVDLEKSDIGVVLI